MYVQKRPVAAPFLPGRKQGHGRVVGPEHRRLKDQLFLSLVERLQQFSRRLNPIAQRTARECAGRGA